MTALPQVDTQVNTEIHPTTAPVRVSLALKVLYGLGDISNAVKLVVFGLFTLFFYTTVMGLSGTLVGIASGIGLIWDAVIDPYIGFLSDRARDVGLGRRHNFMLVGSLTMGVSLYLLFSPPQGLSTWGLFGWLLATTLLVRTTSSIYGVPYFTLGAEMSDDYHERTSITGVRAILALLGTMAAAALSFLVFFPDEVPGVDPKLNYDGYPLMGIVFGAGMTILGLLATFSTLSARGQLARQAQQPADAASSSPRAFFRSALSAWHTPSFRVMFLSFSLFYLGIVINSALAIHYFSHYAGVTSSDALSSFQVAFYVGGIVGAGLWLFLSRRVEKKVLYITAAVATAGLMSAATLLVGEGRLLGVGNVTALQVGHALAGLFSSIIWILPWSMMADIADEDELQSGTRREGALFGIFFFGQQVAAGLAVVATGLLVDQFAGLAPGVATVSAQTANRIGLLYGLLPGLLVLSAVLLVQGYRLNQPAVAAIQAALQRRAVPDSDLT